MLELTKGVQRQLNPPEKRNNRGLGLGVGGLTLIGLARLTGWPLIPAVIAIGVDNSWPGIKESVQIAVVERRFSIMQLLLLYFCYMRRPHRRRAQPHGRAAGISPVESV